MRGAGADALRRATLASLPPLRLELGGRQVVQRRVDALVMIHLFDEAAQVGPRIGKIAAHVEVELLFLEGARDSLGIRVAGWLADGVHADLDARGLETLGVARGSVLHTLIGVLDLGSTCGQSLVQCVAPASD
jgi:hypothetical protein